MEKWESQSHPGKQIAVAIVCIGFGLTLAVGFYNFNGPGMTNSKAGYLLGLLLLIIGIIAFLTQGTQTVVVDPAARCIIIEDRARFGARRRSIGFHDIVEVIIGYLGKRAIGRVQ